MPAQRQIRFQDHGEIILALPVRNAVEVVEAVDPDMLGLAVGAGQEIIPAGAPLLREVGQIFGIVKRRDRLRIGAEAQDLPAMAAKLIERRARSVIIMPGLVGEDGGRLSAPRPEAAARIGADQCAGPPPEGLGEPADLREDGGVGLIDGRRPRPAGRPAPRADTR